MDTEQRPYVSIIDPIGPAITKVKEILFRPFDLAKWFVIGFCAWLANLGKGGGGGGGGSNFNFNAAQQNQFHHTKDAFFENLSWIIPVAIVGVILFLGIGIILTWLSSRGKFMFLHCVAENKAEVKIPWRKFQKQGNSLFLFRLVVGILSLICIAILLGLIIFLIILCDESDGATMALFIIGLIFLALLIIAVAVSIGVLMKFTKDFVVPIMFLSAERCVEAWRKLLSIFSINKARFALYILFQIVIGMAIGGIILALAICTCCCACCFMVIPYIGTVLLLPLLVFSRAYSLLYLKQYSSQFDVFAVSESSADEGIAASD